MAIMKGIIDLKGILFFMLLTFTTEATNLDCYGKAFHCVNSTHFMICVDIGGTSQTLDDFIIQCPPSTVCKITNRFECEFPLPSIPTSTDATVELMITENEVTTFAPLPVSSVPFEEYLNTVSITTLPQNERQETPRDTIGISPVNPISGGLDTSDFTTTVNVITNKPILNDVNTTPMVVIDSILSSKPSDMNLQSSSNSTNNDQATIVQIGATETSNLTTENNTLVLLPSKDVTGNEPKENIEIVFTSNFETTLESITENTFSSDITTAVVNKTTSVASNGTEQVVTTTPEFAIHFQEVNATVVDYTSLTTTVIPLESINNFSKGSASQVTKDELEPVSNNSDLYKTTIISTATDHIDEAESSMLHANQSISSNATLLQSTKNETIENAEPVLANSVIEPSVVQKITEITTIINTEVSINDYITETTHSITEQTVTNEQVTTMETGSTPGVTILNNLSLAPNASAAKNSENSRDILIITGKMNKSVTDSFGNNNLEFATTVLSTVDTNSAGTISKPRQEPLTTQERILNDFSPTTEHVIISNEPMTEEKVTNTKEFTSVNVKKLGVTNITNELLILENKTSDLFHISVSKDNTSSTARTTGYTYPPSYNYGITLSGMTTSISNTIIEEPLQTDILSKKLNSSTTDPNIFTEIETTTLDNNIETLINNIIPPVNNYTEKNITDPLSDAESIVSEINNHNMGNKTDKITQNEEVLSTGFEDNQASTQDYKSELRSAPETATLRDISSKTSSTMSDLSLLEQTTTVDQVHNSKLNVESVKEAPTESTIVSSVSLSPEFTTMDGSSPRKDMNPITGNTSTIVKDNSRITLKDVETQPVTDMSSTLIHIVNKSSQFNTAPYIQKQESHTTDQYQFHTARNSEISTWPTIENENQTLQSEIIPIDTSTSLTSTTITITEAAASSSPTDYSFVENANKIYETTIYSNIDNTESKIQPFYSTSSTPSTGTNTSEVYPSTDSIAQIASNTEYINNRKVPTEPFNTSDNYQTHKRFGPDTTLTASNDDSAKPLIIPLKVTESSLVQVNDSFQNTLLGMAGREHNSAFSTANTHNHFNTQFTTNANNVGIDSVDKITTGISLTESVNIILNNNKSANEKPTTETNRTENDNFGSSASAITTQEIITMNLSTNDDLNRLEPTTQSIPVTTLPAKTESPIVNRNRIVNSDKSQISTVRINNTNEKSMDVRVTDIDLRKQTTPFKIIQAPFSHSDLHTATIGERNIDNYNTPTSSIPGKQTSSTSVINDIQELSHISTAELKLHANIEASSIPITFDTENESITESIVKEPSVSSTTSTPVTHNHDFNNLGPSNNYESTVVTQTEAIVNNLAVTKPVLSSVPLPTDTTAIITSKYVTSDLQMNVRNTEIPYRATDLYLGQSQSPENRDSTTFSGDSTNAANTHTTDIVDIKTSTEISSSQIQSPGNFMSNSASTSIPGVSTDAANTKTIYAVNQTIADLSLGENKSPGSFGRRDDTIASVAGANAESTKIVDTVNLTIAELSWGQVESPKNLFNKSANILLPDADNAINQNTTIFDSDTDTVSTRVIDASNLKTTINLDQTQSSRSISSSNESPQTSATMVEKTKIIINPPYFETNSPMPIKITDTEDSLINVDLTFAPVERNLANTDYSPIFTNNTNTKIYEETSTVATFSTRQSTAAKKVNQNIENNSEIILEPTPKVTALDDQNLTGIEDNSKSKASLSSADFGTPTEMMTTVDVLVNSHMESDSTHSGIIYLMTKRPKSLVHKEYNENLKNNETEVKKQNERVINVKLSNLQGKVASSTGIPIVPLKEKRELQTDINARQPLITTENSNYNTTNYNSEHFSTKLHKNVYNGTNTTTYKNEMPLHESIKNITSSTYDMHISKDKSLDQNMSFLDSHKTVISNDQKSTPRYMLGVKPTAAVYTQTTSFPALKSATRKTELNKFSCRRMKRGRYADELDCKKFYICIGNRSSHVIEGTCPVNTVFSEINKQCTKNLSHCIRNNQFRCVTEGRFSDFLNDNVYYICVRNNPGHFIRFKLQCQNGYHLNKTSVRCDLNTESTSSSLSQDSKSVSEQSSSSIKRDVKVKTERFTCKKEGIFPDPSNCRIYYKCSKGHSSYRQKRKKCDSDEIFHKDKKKCVDADSYEC